MAHKCTLPEFQLRPWTVNFKLQIFQCYNLSYIQQNNLIVKKVILRSHLFDTDQVGCLLKHLFICSLSTMFQRPVVLPWYCSGGKAMLLACQLSLICWEASSAICQFLMISFGVKTIHNPALKYHFNNISMLKGYFRTLFWWGECTISVQLELTEILRGC